MQKKNIVRTGYFMINSFCRFMESGNVHLNYCWQIIFDHFKGLDACFNFTESKSERPFLEKIGGHSDPLFAIWSRGSKAVAS